MIEQICRALCIADGLDPDRKFKSSDWSEDTAPHELAWHEYQPRARAVLRSIREPSAEMIEAGDRAILSLGLTRGLGVYGTEQCWPAMIDAALKE